MNRNLDRRIELMFPILDREVFKQVKNILNSYFEDNVSAQVLQESGDWIPVPRKNGENPYRVQEVLYQKYKKRFDSANKEHKIDFQVRRKD